VAFLISTNPDFRKNGNHVPAELVVRVEALIKRFQSQASRPQYPSRRQGIYSTYMEPDSFVIVSLEETVKMVNSLYPSRRPASFASEGDTFQSGLQSSASSVSGFSLFRNANLSEQVSAFSRWPQDPSHSLNPMQNEISEAFYPDEDGLDVERFREAAQALEELRMARTSSTNLWATFNVIRRSVGLQAPVEDSMRVSDEATTFNQPENQTSAVNRCRSIVEQLLTDEKDDFAGLHASEWPLEIYDALENALQERTVAAQESSDFVAAHAWLCDLNALREIRAKDAKFDTLRQVLNLIEEQSQDARIRTEVGMDACDAWLRIATPSLDLSMDKLLSNAAAIGQMRYKMWYVSDVRTSAAYDEARSVAAALRIMGKPKRQARTRVAPPLRHWSGSKISNTSLHLKTEAQILELLSASLEQGGPNKLSDEQARATVQWMERNGIENLCRGEERLHRLCMEIRKCIDALTSKESSFLASNPLFALEELHTDRPGAASPSSSLRNLNSTANFLGQLNLNTSIAPSIDAMTNSSLPLSSSSSREHLASRSPTLTHKSSAPFWSPAITEAQSPSSATSIGSYHTQTAARSSPKKSVSLRNRERDGHSKIEQLKQSLTGLLVSDMTALLFNEGSETDVAFWTGLGGSLVDNHFRSFPSVRQCSIATDTLTPQSCKQTFDFDTAFRTMLCSFASTSNPFTKIAILYDIDRMLPMYMTQHPCDPEPANVHLRKEALGLGLLHDQPGTSKADDNVKGFCRLFRDSRFRPTGIFRDLQYIAALLPSTILETTPQGKAFWNAAVAVSDVQQQARNVMVETADNIIAYHSNNRGPGRSSSVAQQKRDSATFSAPSRSASSEEISRYSMADAAYLLQITAKEGDPVAQRELATLYLTHPELMDHIIAPLSRPKDVFKEELEGKWRRDQDPNRCDPATMCVAHHWMTLSAKGGDALAAAYLKQREEMDLLL